MKTFLSWSRISGMMMVAGLCCTHCSDPAEEVTPPQPQQQQEITQKDADKFLESLGFTQSKKVNGAPPAVTNTSAAQMDSKDTVYAVPGQKLPVRVSHSETISIKGFFLTADNASYFLDIFKDQEEDSKSVSVFFLEAGSINTVFPGASELHVPVKIIPYDTFGIPIDILQRVITIEEENKTCDILSEGDTTSGGPPEWVWHYTAIFDQNGQPTFVNAPGRVFSSTQKPTGCCHPSACPLLTPNPANPGTFYFKYDSEVTAETSYSIELEFFNFYKDGTFDRTTIENITNFNPATTDWCAKIPGYNKRDSHVTYYGTHDYSPGDTNISYKTDRYECDDPLGLCGYGSRPGDLSFTCHSMFITTGREGSKEVRMYRRHGSSQVFWD